MHLSRIRCVLAKAAKRTTTLNWLILNWRILSPSLSLKPGVEMGKGTARGRVASEPSKFLEPPRIKVSLNSARKGDFEPGRRGAEPAAPDSAPRTAHLPQDRRAGGVRQAPITVCDRACPRHPAQIRGARWSPLGTPRPWGSSWC